MNSDDFVQVCRWFEPLCNFLVSNRIGRFYDYSYCIYRHFEVYKQWYSDVSIDPTYAAYKVKQYLLDIVD